MFFSFSNPEYLFLLFLIPLFILIHFLTLRSSKRKALKFANFQAIARIKGIEFFSKNIVSLFLSIVVVFLLVMAVSGMRVHVQREASDFSFVIAIDTSTSMEADDMLPNRLVAAKDAANSFISFSPPTTEIGVVSFSGNSYIEQDITKDKQTLQRAVDGVELSSIEGTDIYEAVITSTNVLKNREAAAVIVLSDGQLNVGDVETIIEYSVDNSVTIHTIGIGTEEGGRTKYGISKLDEDTLKAVAYNTEGVYLRAVDRAGIEESMKQAMNLTKKKVIIELSFYLILGAVIIFCAEYYLTNTRYRTIP
jgi:Ca-activated chloride channel family protein